MEKIKISIDYDLTLSDSKIQFLAKFLIKIADVWILTSRVDDAVYDQNCKRIGYSGQNLDLRKIAEKIGIPENKIIFTGGDYKENFYFKNKFDLHIDDDIREVDKINKNGGNALLFDANIDDLKNILFND